MSKGVFLLGVGIAVVALAFAVTNEVLGPSPGVTEANARRIKPGMDRQQVEAILGGRGRWITSSSGWHGRRPGYSSSSAYEWTGPAGVATVTFDGDLQFEDAGLDRNGSGLVEEVTFVRSHGANPLARLRAWLGR